MTPAKGRPTRAHLLLDSIYTKRPQEANADLVVARLGGVRERVGGNRPTGGQGCTPLSESQHRVVTFRAPPPTVHSWAPSTRKSPGQCSGADLWALL